MRGTLSSPSPEEAEEEAEGKRWRGGAPRVLGREETPDLKPQERKNERKIKRGVQLGTGEARRGWGGAFNQKGEPIMKTNNSHVHGPAVLRCYESKGAATCDKVFKHSRDPQRLCFALFRLAVVQTFVDLSELAHVEPRVTMRKREMARTKYLQHVHSAHTEDSEVLGIKPRLSK